MRQRPIFRVFLAAFFASAVFAQQPTQQWVILHQFGPGSQSVTAPSATLVEASPGAFIGCYLEGLFGVTSGGAFDVLSSFSSDRFAGATPGALTPASNGYLYGVAFSGENASEVYRINNAGQKTAINNSLFAASPLVEGADGNLWGTQGSDSTGYSVFKMSLAGALTTVARGMTGQTLGPLLQASDGNFYGATYAETAADSGQIYRVSPSGQFAALYTFPVGEGSVGGLIQASNGLVYGTWLSTASECPNPGGGVFSISLSGSYQSVLEFAGCYPSGIPVGPDAGLLEASDGRLYGSTVELGTYGDGSVFSMNLNGSSFEKVAEFNSADGANPATFGAAVVQGSDGSLYGTTTSGGSGEGGTVFQFNLGLTPPLPGIRLAQPSSGTVGATVLLAGNYLLNLTGVSFNGTPAAFTPINVNYAEAVVPTGATTGPITVTTMNGSVTTKSSFTVK
jgi:uncharacterized repeat protein (TIGR03803 family)